MCGRFTIVQIDKIETRFQAKLLTSSISAQYNCAPGQFHPAILSSSPQEISSLFWGLLPLWNPQASRLINARSETILQKKTFRQSFQKRRCLVLADSFYEWKKTPQGKIPLRFTLLNGEVFAFAGIYQEEEQGIKSFAILTTEPNSLVQEAHDRMPVILREEEEHRWLDENTSPEICQNFLKPFPSSEMKCYSVSSRINSALENDPSLIEPVPFSGSPQKELF